MMGLAPHSGHERAHDLVYELCSKAIEQGKPLVDLLSANAEVTRHLDRATPGETRRPGELCRFVRQGRRPGIAYCGQSTKRTALRAAVPLCPPTQRCNQRI